MWRHVRLFSHKSTLHHHPHPSPLHSYCIVPSINVKCGEHELADLDLGMHAISRVWCARCQSPLGLKILRVPSTTLESTAGKYLLDCCALVRQSG